MQLAEKQLIEEKFKGVIALITSSNDINSIQHQELIAQQNKILEQVLITNGRVTKLEKETRTVRYFSDNPKITFLLFAGILAIASLFELKDIINLFK